MIWFIQKKNVIASTSTATTIPAKAEKRNPSVHHKTYLLTKLFKYAMHTQKCPHEN